MINSIGGWNEKEGCETTALYHLFLFINHSCEPNAVAASFFREHGNQIIIKTIREVKQGEKLSIEYVPVSHFSAVEERRKELPV